MTEQNPNNVVSVKKYVKEYVAVSIIHIISDIIIFIYTLMMLFAPIYETGGENSWIQMRYSVFDNFRLFYDLIKFFEFGDESEIFKLFFSFEIITIILLLITLVVALVNMILNFIFLSNPQGKIENQSLNLTAKGVMPKLKAMGLFITAISLVCFIAMLNFVTYDESYTTFFGNKYNMSIMPIFIILLSVLVMLMFICGLIKRKTEMRFFVEQTCLSDEIDIATSPEVELDELANADEVKDTDQIINVDSLFDIDGK